MGYYEELSGAVQSPGLQNRLLFELLCDDRRTNLYAELRDKAPVLEFPSRAARPDAEAGKEFPQQAYLLTRAQDIERALRSFSNAPYKPIGSGTFVLALDNGAGHEVKREVLYRSLATKQSKRNEIEYVAALACYHAMVAVSKKSTFDVATDVAEQAALRFVAAFFGIPDQYHLHLQEAMRRAYRAMIFQMFARHFVNDPQVLAEGNAAMTGLARLIGGLSRELDCVASAAKLAPIFAQHADAALTLCNDIAAAANDVPAMRLHVAGYADQLLRPGLAVRTAIFLDRVIDYPALGKAALAKIGKAVDIDESLRAQLVKHLQQAMALRQSREEQLVPRTFALEGEQLSLLAQNTSPAKTYCRESVLERMMRSPEPQSPTEIAVAVVGSIAGIIGNVIASTCIVLQRYFDLSPAQRSKLTAALHPAAGIDDEGLRQRIDGAQTLLDFIRRTLTLDPPPPFVPRMTTRDEIFKAGGKEITVPAGSEILVPLGAATGDPANPSPGVDFFGHPSGDVSSHRCLGDHLALPLVAHVVRNVLVLPALSQVMVDGEPVRLKKKWGFICESLPLQYDCSAQLRQEPLNVVMKIRQPVEEHAAALKSIVQSSVPSIERVLAGSKIVHFARFVFLNNDTELGLFTVYDGPFDDYIEFFATVAGPLFDKIFEHIEAQPPRPVRQNAGEFVKFIARYNVPSAGGYFFSAYPRRVVREEQT